MLFSSKKKPQMVRFPMFNYKFSSPTPSTRAPEISLTIHAFLRGKKLSFSHKKVRHNRLPTILLQPSTGWSLPSVLLIFSRDILLSLLESPSPTKWEDVSEEVKQTGGRSTEQGKAGCLGHMWWHTNESSGSHTAHGWSVVTEHTWGMYQMQLLIVISGQFLTGSRI